MNPQVTYLLVKILSIAIGVAFTPLSVYIGFLFGEGKTKKALRFVALAMLLGLVDGISFWWLVEANS